jgi:hypothetical protein
MLLDQRRWTAEHGWELMTPQRETAAASDLVVVFGDTQPLGEDAFFRDIRAAYPRAQIVSCSSGGEICGTEVSEASVVATAMQFDHTRVRAVCERLVGAADSAPAGARLARGLPHDGLRHVFVVSEGLDVNGSELVRGLTANLPEGVAVTGGLSADAERFQTTLVGLDEAPAPQQAVAVGFYGEHLQVGFGSLGGWDTFGPDRLITRSQGNVLYELDGLSALDLYKRYLGPYAEELPASGLLFPLRLATASGEPGVVRTILGVDEAEGSLRFAGDVPQGMYARLMKANLDRLIDGAAGAASATHARLGPGVDPDLAILVSCIGRKLVLKQRVEEEVENVRDTLGPSTVLSGFYSYGEISPMTPSAKCELHNQTMTITTFAER